MDTDVTSLDHDIRGLDVLEVPMSERDPLPVRLWAGAWPKFMAVGLVLAFWQLVYLSGWKDPWVLPGPGTVLSALAEEAQTARFWEAVATTMRRGATGFAVAVATGTAIGLAVSQSGLLRRAIGSLITGLQTMPSIVWFPLAILLFGLDESAILFVIVLGAAPSIANGLIAGVDHIPPILVRAGRVLGARGLTAWRHVLLPAALPSYVAGLKQGWAFSWRSLMAGELLVIIAERPSLGVSLHFARELAQASRLMAYMIVVLVIGVIVDAVFFAGIERRIRANRGLQAVR
jgi:NitT/TauT family transport system permease protein